LLEFDLPVQFIHGNGELAMLAQMAATDTQAVIYWGTTSGNPPPEPIREVYRWTAQQLKQYEPVLASWRQSLQIEIEGLGKVLFCHATPRSETEIFTRLTAEARLVPLFEELDVSVVVCGHTHMQFDRMVGRTRIVNAGSIGEPYGEPFAYWLLLGPGIEMQRTSYDFARAAELIRRTDYPQAEEFANDLLRPPSEAEMLELFSKWEVR
jgi:diadenosine tetraphosphatase ApaH/serine/threonine PP2A family protein phosphatase